MKTIVWEKKYELGIESLDKEHKQLFAIINKLFSLIEDENKSEWACQECIKYLQTHTLKHFRNEEDYMFSIHHSNYEIHKRLHDNFRLKTLPALEQELEATHYSEGAIRHFTGVIVGWLVSHTLTEDMTIVGKKPNKYINVPPEKEMDALEQAIIQTSLDVTRLKTKTVSLHYDGEDFGKTVCIRFLYHGKNNENWEIIINYEQKLLLTLVSNLLNSQYKRIDDMVLNITRFFARQFLEKLRESFPALDLFELKNESLITHEQLVKAFDKSQPTYSMLFDTGEGYFSFSVSSSNFVKSNISSTINEENVTGEIFKYLRGGKKKKKIMVVDDSDFMLQNLRTLLENDYEVSECTSAMSAIKKIALDKPDLILLDYEMPVCDGKQTMEMLRSDEDTANIPIIFLTAKCDMESVRKVMSLKPRGYLLKSMPEKDIKKVIDGLFVQRTQKVN